VCRSSSCVPHPMSSCCSVTVGCYAFSYCWLEAGRAGLRSAVKCGAGKLLYACVLSVLCLFLLLVHVGGCWPSRRALGVKECVLVWI
jgi:hypothetical protein